MDIVDSPESGTASNIIFENFVKNLKGSLDQDIECSKKNKKTPVKRKRKEEKKTEFQKLNLTKKTVRSLIATEQQEVPAYTAAIIKTDW